MTIKYFINHRYLEARSFANRMREAGVEFSSIPTSGPLLLRINGSPHYGPMAVKRAVGWIIDTLAIEKGSV